MATNRNLTFVNSYVYHVYNRGVERRQIFTTKREYRRFLAALEYYRYRDAPVKYSKFISLPGDQQTDILNSLKKSPMLVDVFAYCLMPNHFHLLLRQNMDNGVSDFVRKTSNSYAKYFNTKQERVGPLFQNIFKSVWIETDEQLLHVSRYIHLNPVTSSIVAVKNLLNYPWSSLGQYLYPENNSFVYTDEVLGLFKSSSSYKKFVLNQVDYVKNLNVIEDLTIEKPAGFRRNFIPKDGVPS